MSSQNNNAFARHAVRSPARLAAELWLTNGTGVSGQFLQPQRTDVAEDMGMVFACRMILANSSFVRPTGLHSSTAVSDRLPASVAEVFLLLQAATCLSVEMQQPSAGKNSFAIH